MGKRRWAGRSSWGDGNREENRGWGEHREKVEAVGVDVEEKAGNESFVTENYLS